MSEPGREAVGLASDLFRIDTTRIGAAATLGVNVARPNAWQRVRASSDMTPAI